MNKRRPAAKNIEFEESDDTEDEESESQDSGTEPQEPAEDNPGDSTNPGPEADSPGPDTPDSAPVEAKMINAALDVMRSYYEQREEEKNAEPEVKTVEV